MTPGHKTDQTGHKTTKTGQSVTGTPGHASRAQEAYGSVSRLSPVTPLRDKVTHRRDTSPLRSELSPGHLGSQNLSAGCPASSSSRLRICPPCNGNCTQGDFCPAADCTPSDPHAERLFWLITLAALVLWAVIAVVVIARDGA